MNDLNERDNPGNPAIAAIIGALALAFLGYLALTANINQQAKGYIICVISAVAVGGLFGVIGGFVAANVQKKSKTDVNSVVARGGIAALLVTLVIMIGAFRASMIHPDTWFSKEQSHDRK